MNLSKNLKDKIRLALNEIIRRDGSICYSMVPDLLSKKCKINWQDYRESQEGLESWLSKNFLVKKDTHSFILVDNDKGTDILSVYLESHDFLEIQKLREILKENGLFLDESTDLLEWVMPRIPPECYLSSDKRRILHWMSSEIDQMHSFAFMNRWNINCQKLNACSGMNYSEEQWRTIVAHVMAANILGLNKGILNDSANDCPRIAFSLDVQNADGKTIYCVLQKNPQNTDGQKQTWAIVDFCYPGESDSNGCGQWLVNRFDICDEPIDVNNIELDVLKDLISQLNTVKDDLNNHLTDWTEVISKGLPPEEKYLQTVRLYYELWEKVKDILPSFPWLSTVNPVSVNTIQAQLADKNLEFSIIQAILDEFKKITAGMHKFLTDNRMSIPEVPTTQKDQEEAERLLLSATADSCSTFSQILGVYKNVRIIMESSEVDAKVDSVIAVAAKHFTEYNERMIAHYFTRVSSEERQFLDGLSEIETLLSKLEGFVAPASDETEPCPTVGELLSQYISLRDAAVLDLTPVHARYLPADKVEAAIAAADWDTAENLLSTNPQMYGFEPAEADSLINKIHEKNTQLSNELSLYYAGIRISEILGNRNQTAIKYWIASMKYRQEDCQRLLLTGLCDVGDAENFYRLYVYLGSSFPLDEQCLAFLLRILAQKGSASLKTYLKDNIALTYSASFLKNASLTETFDSTIDWKPRLEAVYAFETPDEIETAVIRNDTEKLSTAAVNPLPEGTGYSAAEIQKIHDVLTDEYPTGNSDYETGVRLLTFIGNRHRLAESYFWNDLAHGNNPDSRRQLSVILSQEQRWTECLSLMNRTGSQELLDSKSSLVAYLSALLFADPDNASGFILSRLQTCLACIFDSGSSSDNLLYTKVCELCDKSNTASGDFFRQMVRLSETFANPVYQAIILQGGKLREIMVQYDLLEKAGIHGNLAEKCGSLYRTDQYPHGIDALEVANRLYAFLGVYDGIAEIYARFALQYSEEAVYLLKKIYHEMGDSAASYELFQKYPCLRKEFLQEYRDYLLQNEEYQQYIDFVTEDSSATPTDVVNLMIARAKTGQSLEAILDTTDFVFDSIPCESLVKLLDSASCIKLNTLADFYISHIEDFLRAYPAAGIKMIVSLNGKLQEDDIRFIQQTADEKGCTVLAVYIYETFHIGDFHEQAERLTEHYLENFEHFSLEKRINTIFKLKIIFENHRNPALSEMFVQTVPKVLLEYPESQALEVITNMEHGLEIPSGCYHTLLHLTSAQDQKYSYNICAFLYKICTSDLLDEKTVYLFNQSCDPETVLRSNDYINLICEIYYSAFIKGCFPAEIIENVRDLMMRVIGSSMNEQALFCLYQIEKYLNHSDRVEFTFCFLLTVCRNIRLKETLNSEKESVRENGSPEIYDAFCTALQKDMDSIEDFVNYCITLCSHTNISLLNLDSFLEDIHSDVGVDKGKWSAFLIMLFADKDNPVLWKALSYFPEKNDPVIYSKILYLTYLHSPKGEKATFGYDCMDYFERSGIDDLLLRVLIDNVRLVESPFDLKNYREKLIQRVDNDKSYFLRWKDQDILDTLAELLCDQLLKNPFNHDVNFSHAAIRDTITLCIVLNRQKAFKIMLDKLRESVPEHPDLFFAAVCQLLLADRIKEAKDLLTKLDTYMVVFKYRTLINTLVKMNEEQLHEWASDEADVQLMNLILPDGNYPDLQSIQKMGIDSILSHRQDVGSRTLSELLSIQRDDPGALEMLFILCKEDFNGRLNVLYNSVCGQIRSRPGAPNSRLFLREKKEYALYLAYLNAVILANEWTDQIKSTGYNDNINFDVEAGTYYRQYNASILTSEADQFNQLQRDISSCFANQTPQTKALLSDLILCRITGNWTVFLDQCFSNSVNFQDLLANIYDQEEVLHSGTPDNRKKFFNGFVRSALEVYYHYPDNQKAAFINSLKTMLGTTRYGSMCTKHIEAIITGDYFDQLSKELIDEEFLKYPFEEYSLFVVNYERTLQQLISKAPQQTYACVYLIAYLVNNQNALYQFIVWADEAFDKGFDQAAFGIYKALIELVDTAMLFSAKPNQKKRCKALSRVSGIFCGDRATIDQVIGEDFTVCNCINMVTFLLTTARADEVRNLKKHLAQKYDAVCEAILTIINRNISDEEKLALILSFSDPVTLTALCYFAKAGFDKPQTKFLKSVESSKTLNTKYLEMTVNFPNFFDGKKFKPYINLPIPINPKAYKQKEVSNTAVPVVQVPVQIKEEQIPASASFEVPRFVREIECPPLTDQNLQSLQQQYDRCDLFDYKNRYQLSRDIYRITCDKVNVTEEEQISCIIKFGIDYYRYCFSCRDNTTIMGKSNNIILELMQMKPLSTSAEYKSLVDLVRTSAMHELLYKGYQKIQDLVNDFVKYRTSFLRMRDMLSDPSHLQCVNVIINLLDKLSGVYISIAEANSVVLRDELKIAAEKLEQDQTYLGWPEVKLKFRSLLQEEINHLDQRPELETTILNEGSVPVFGKLFGMVHNSGRASARNLIIQVSYNDNNLSKRYVLDRLDAGDSTAFAIYYSLPDTAQLLQYEFVISYEYKNEHFNVSGSKGILPIVNPDGQMHRTAMYKTDAPVDAFSMSADGEVYSLSFFGRKDEKQQIQNLFMFDNFYDYRNVLIRGIRRAGKTSLLNYLKAYVKYRIPDTITVYIDCHSISNNIIYTVFVGCVLKSMEADYPELCQTEQWKQFCQEWTAKADNFDPSDLPYFYIGILNTTGKHLILVIDEIDSAFSKIEQTMGLESSAFASLRSLLCNSQVQHALHLVFCGSNELIRYGMDGKIMNQLFQQFGDSIIEVGRLPKDDMCEMLVQPYQNDPVPVQYTPAALESIWNCTGGLVWFTKLLGNSIIQYIQGQNRHIVYPYDVYTCLPNILNDNIFKEIINNSRMKELVIMDALQSLTSKPTEYTTLRQLRQLLNDSMEEEELEAILNTLIQLQYVQRHAASHDSYRFAVPLYWYYFRQHPSKFERVPEIGTLFNEIAESVISYDD